MEIVFRKAVQADLQEIWKILKLAMAKLDSEEIFQWDDEYPDKNILIDDINKQDMSVGLIDNRIVLFYIVSQEGDVEYAEGEWTPPEVEFRVVHRLCVHPDYQGRGLGKTAMHHIEAVAKSEGVKLMCLDSFSKNPYSLGLYEGLGYKTVGYAEWKLGRFNLMQKYL